MRTRTLLVALVVGLLAVALVAPASAGRRDAVSQYGHGTWTVAGDGFDVAGATEGAPVAGPSTGHVRPGDGTMPPWGGCEPGSGTFTTSTNRSTLTVRFWGDFCRAVAPAGYVVFKGWYDVTEYTGGKGKKGRTAEGRGGMDLYLFADGSSQWSFSGDLY